VIDGLSQQQGGSILVEAPPKPLTPEQQRIVLSELHLYFAGFYQSGYPYQMPTFRPIKHYYHPDHVPDDVSVGQIARRPPHGISDPTGTQACINIDGPRAIEVWVGERQSIDTAVFRKLAIQLPTHLAGAYDLILVQRRTSVAAAEKLHIGRETVSAYAHTSVRVIASWLYAERWQEQEVA